jgi:hypothetical protein
MHKSTRSLLLAASALLAVCSASAQAIIGAWSFGDTSAQDSGVVVLFSHNSTNVYFQIENSSTGTDGFERGTWAWNETNGTAFTASVDNDTNDDIGLSSINPLTTKLSLSGDTLTLIDPDGESSGSADFTRVTGGGALIGAWYVGNPDTTGTTNDSGVLVFLQSGFNGTVYSGNFFLARDLPAGDPDGADEIEHGTYTWNPSSGAFTFGSTLIDQNSETGLLSSPTVTNFTVSGGILTGFDGEAFTLNSISAIPEPSTYAMLAGVAALGLAVWHRRRKLAV